jgi:hypothetical protein
MWEKKEKPLAAQRANGLLGVRFKKGRAKSARPVFDFH